MALEGITFLIDKYAIIEKKETDCEVTDDEIRTLILGVLLSSVNIFSDDYFRQPLFLLQPLFRLSKEYRLDKVPNRIINQLQLSGPKKENTIFNTHIWFLSFMVPSMEIVLAVVNRYCLGT